MRNALRSLTLLILAVASLASAQRTELVLPDGSRCIAVGPDLAVGLAGGEVSYFCQDGVALLGDLVLRGDIGLVTRVDYDPAQPGTVLNDALVPLELRSVTLENGAVCRHAGRGATLALGDERANYTCDDGSVLVGPFERSGGQVFATMAQVLHGDDGLYLADDERVLVTGLDARDPIVGVRWTLASFEPDGAPALADAPATLLIEDGKAGGTTGCNSYFAGVSLGLDGAVSFGPAGSTMMYCEGAMDQEQGFLETLAAVDSYRLTADGELVLSGPAGELVFVR